MPSSTENLVAAHTVPLLEFDSARRAMIEPTHVQQPLAVIAPHCVLCFFNETIERFCGEGRGKIIHDIGSERGRVPIYQIDFDGQPLIVVHPGVGAPLCVATVEEMIALGCQKFVACGSAGVLDSTITVGHVIVPVSAVRDEGTSYHYLPASREVEQSPEAVAALERVLARHHVPYLKGKTWTTDAIYRETAAKVALRRAEGCLSVEMEASAFFAVAQFRGVTFGQLLYGGDNLDGDTWDHRDFLKQYSTRDKLFMLAAEACLSL